MTTKILLTFCLLLLSTQVFTQKIDNPSFEGTPGEGNSPQGWFACNLYSTPDTQPGTWNVDNKASHGSTYISLVTRGNTSSASSNYTEAIGSQLFTPLMKGETYAFKIDLALSSTFISSYDDGTTISFNNPVVLKIWGGTSNCYKDEILWSSDPIENINWKTYTMEVSPKVRSYSYLVLEANFVGEVPYFGNILIDNFVECPKIDLLIPTDTTICAGDNLVLDAYVKDAEYIWNTNSTDSKITIKNTGIYSVKVTSFCTTKEFEINVSAQDCNCDLNTSNVFTPNGDGINDLFTFTSDSNVGIFDLTIINRWGRIVFKSNDIKKSWDGKINESSGSTGVYYWHAKVMCVSNNRIHQKEQKGIVTLLR